MASTSWDVEDTELYNDNGFVYKRRKRTRSLEQQASTATELSAADLQPELKKRKKRTLYKLKERYQREIRHWELLSNTLHAMEQKSQQSQQPQQPNSPDDSTQPSSSTLVPELDELLKQVEVQDSIFRDISMLCDTAESMLRAEEERRKQPFIDLPVWKTSPRRLLATLCEDDDDCNDNAHT